MNVLVEMLGEQGLVDWLVREAAHGARVPAGSLVAAWAEGQPTTRGWTWLAALDDADALGGSFLWAVAADAWEAMLKEASGQRVAARAGARFVAAADHQLGLMVPDDVGASEQLAFYRGASGGIAFQPGRANGGALPAGAHCALPEPGRCRPGACGLCRLSEVWRPGTSAPMLTCTCPC